jgi:chaperonin GroES
MAKITPLADRVVAKREEKEQKTASGLYLPDNAQEQSKTAVVDVVGSDVKNIKKGERILFKDFSSTEVKVDGVEYIIVKEEDVLATVK